MAAFNFYDLSREALAAVLVERCGEPQYRASQLFNWVYKKETTDFSLMTNIKGELREKFSELFSFELPKISERQISNDGTRKYLMEVQGGDLVESVMIKQPKRMTLCVSSQVGCAMGCKFCRTATMGLKRNLSPAEIIGQVLMVAHDAKNFGDSFQNIVFMGMGEPLHNFDGVANTLRILHDDEGIGFGPRRVTVSTSGIVPAIQRYGAEGLEANLAVSLNATTDEVRTAIMPVNKRYPINELLESLANLALKPRKSITIEYVLLSGVNDTHADMERLPRLLANIPAKVNLIPYNSNAGLGFFSPEKEWVFKWRDYLLSKGQNVTIRWSKGVDIGAACGQLVTASARTKRKAVESSLAIC